MIRRKSASDLTLATIRRELEEQDNKPLLIAASLVVGGVMVVGGVATAGVAALGLLAGKDEAFKVADSLVAKSRKRRKEGPGDRHRRMLAAHQLMVYATFLETGAEVLECIKRHARSDMDESAFSALALAWMAHDEAASRKDKALKQHLVVATPHPADSLEDYDADLYAFYSRLAANWRDLLASLPVDSEEAARDIERAQVVLATLPADAVDRYNGRYCTLVADNPQFKAWVHLRDNDHVARCLARLPDEVAERLRSEAFSQPALDVGLAELSAQLAEFATAPRRHRAGEVVDELARKYEAAAAKPIIEGAGGHTAGAPTVSYPPRRAAFIPQAFKALRTTALTATSVRLADEGTWAEIPAREDLSEFLLTYLQSDYSLEAPLIILGLPGSGKSLLSEMIAAHTAAKHFTSIRVELRKTRPASKLYEQLERQIADDTLGQRVSWPDFAKELLDRPPLAIFDGFDELLQAEGDNHASFIEDLQRFQEEEADLGRDLRAIVTSRPTLIDKARVPPGCTVIRLLDFDARRIDEWIAIWNDHNDAYFKQSGTRPFELPARADVRQLAGQPLLLVLLALFDSDGNRLSDQPDVDRAKLYNELLVSFIRRQRGKDEETRNLSDVALQRVIGGDMRQLGVAAISMFNRGALHVLSEQLDRDLAFFVPEKSSESADDLFGRFFFVHVSRSGTRRGEPGSRDPAAYEFLHNTFGEFLMADFILRALVEEIGAQIDAVDDPARRQDYARLIDETSQPHAWCARLMFASLHTRPVVLEMMRSWLPHLLVEQGLAPRQFTAQLDTFIRAQIARVLGATVPAAALVQNPAPYAPLPLTGHHAIYTLNLILLRVAVDAEQLVFIDDEPSEGRTSSWEQLASLWRGWFSEDHLAAVASFVQTSRREHRVRISRRDLPMGPSGAARLETAWRAASALGDRLTAGALAAHLHDVGDRQPIALLEIGRDLRAEAVDLELELVMRAVRSDGWPRDSERLGTLADHARKAVSLELTSPTHRDLLLALTAADAPVNLRVQARRALPNPRSIEALWLAPDSFAEVYVRFCASVAPRWVGELVGATLRRDPLVRLAQSAPIAFAACLDAARPAHGAVRSDENGAWLAPVVRALLPYDLAPAVLVALLAVATRLDDPGLAAACRERLVSENPRDCAAAISVDRLRLLLELADEPSDNGLAEWLLSGTELAEDSLPADILLGIHRLRLILGRHTRIDRETVARWPPPRSEAEAAALSRLRAALEHSDSGELG